MQAKGKQQFQAKNYEEAMETYTRALGLIENLANKKHLDPSHMDDDTVPQAGKGERKAG